MPPLTLEGKHFVPRVSWYCIERKSLGAAHSRTSSVPSCVKGRRSGISCLPSVVGSIVPAGRPCLKFARMLDEAYGLSGGQRGTVRPTSSRSRAWARGRVARKELYDPRSMRRILTSLGALASWSGVTDVDPAAGKAACRFACEIIDWACSLSSSNQT